MKSKLIDGGGQEKTFALVFDAGEEVVAGLLRFAKDQKVSAAHLTAIGAFERVTLGFFELKKKDYKKIPIEQQVELMSLVGNIAQGDQGEPKLHAHVVVGKSDGTAHGGHFDMRRDDFLREASRVSSPATGTLTPVVIAALEQAKRDLAALRLHDLDHGDRAWTMAAGLPVYVSLFGRDTLTAAWQVAR